MLRIIALMVFSTVFLLAQPDAAHAQSLEQAKASGMVGETASGYLAAVKPEGQAVANSINAERRKEYERIAAQNGQPVDVVEKLMGQKLVNRAGAGEMVQDASGRWIKK